MPVETRKRKAMAQAAVENAEPMPSPPTSATKRQRKLPVRSKDDAAEEKPKTHLAASKKSNVITFDDDGNADQELAIPAKPVEASEPVAQGEESDSDDEAPEAVSTTKAAVEMKKSAQAERKAARELAAAEKKKRQDRDAFFKQQASERKVDSQPEQVPASREGVSSGQPSENMVIPNVLPAEFLTDSDSEEDDEMGSSPGKELPRKRTLAAVEKRMSRDGRGPRDEVIGSTVYRISKRVDERMAPKAKKYSKNSKHLLLKRGRAPVNPRPGFFKN